MCNGEHLEHQEIDDEPHCVSAGWRDSCYGVMFATLGSPQSALADVTAADSAGLSVQATDNRVGSTSGKALPTPTITSATATANTDGTFDVQVRWTSSASLEVYDDTEVELLTPLLRMPTFLTS